MPDAWTCHVGVCFADARPVLDVKYDVEKRVRRLLHRDPERPDALVFRGTQQNTTTAGFSTIELRLESAGDPQSLYVLRLDATRLSEPTDRWEEIPRRAFKKWTSGLALTEDRPISSPDRYRQLIAEFELPQPERDDGPAIRIVQRAILDALRGGKSFRTAHHEGGTEIEFAATRFVVQNYGESNERQEFESEDAFLARLREFYDWEMRFAWSPHQPPEIEAWRYIEREMRD